MEGMKKRVLFVFNPRSGKAQIKNHLLDIIQIFTEAGYEVITYPTQKKGDALQKVKDRDTEYFDLVVCSGGDGTLDEVVAGMIQSGVRSPIGYIPAGSTNDFARSLNIPDDMTKAARHIVEGNVFSCDIGKFNENPFVYVAAFGMFTEVSYATDQQLKNALGHAAYILEGIKSIPTIKPHKMKFTCEERIVEGEFLYGMISNSTSVGGFKTLSAKEVELDDGKFEVTLVKLPANILELRDNAVSMVNNLLDNDYIQTFKTAWIKVESEEEISWTLDGEFGGTHTEVVIENEHKAIDILL